MTLHIPLDLGLRISSLTKPQKHPGYPDKPIQTLDFGPWTYAQNNLHLPLPPRITPLGQRLQPDKVIFYGSERHHENR